MNEQIYQRLREKVSQNSAFFPPTTSGVELKFLKKLFSVEEAEMYLNLTENLETPQQIAERAKQDPEKVAATLEGMMKKGLLFPKRVGDKYYYVAAPFAHGIAEHQVKGLDRELAQLYEDYIWAEKIPEDQTADQEQEITMPTRTLPVKTPVNITRPVAPYEDVKEIIKSHDRIAVTTCF